MRQVITRMMVGLFLVLSPPARADGHASGVAEAIAKARRLVAAGDHSSAATVLEDALLEAQAKDQPTILELLRQSYEILARQTEASGQPRAAAHFRDNLAILNRGRDRTPPATSAKTMPVDPVRPEPTAGWNIPSDSSSRSESRSRSIEAPIPTRPLDSASAPLRTPAPLPASAPLRTPAPLPEPAKPPMPEPLAILLAQPAPQGLSPAGLPGAAGSVAPRERDQDVGRADVDGSRSERPDRTNSGSMSRLSTRSNVGSAAPTGPVRPLAGPSLEEADRLFRSQRYDQAGACYAALARQKRLPDDRKEHWAYCRAVQVVQRVNANPRSAHEWDEIEVEVQRIQRLMPNHWLGPYLSDKIAEVRRGGRGRRSPTPSKNVIVRGSAPETDEVPIRRSPRFFGRSRGVSVSQPDSAASPTATPSGAEPALDLPLAGSRPPPSVAQDRTERVPARRESTGTDPGGFPRVRDADVTPAGDDSAPSSPIAWQIHESANFRIYHCDPNLAPRAAEVAESVRSAQAKRWGSPAVRGPWMPRCNLYLYPTPRSYAQATGQPEISPGISTMTNDGTRVLSRRMNLRADNPQLLTTILPHEVTHIVLADLFVAHQIPRWADEGIAVLAEPRAEQHNRAAELQESLESGRVFKLGQLMAMDYPDEKDWRLYYAQSVSVTRYLVEQGTPDQFLRFLRDTQRIGVEAALRDAYQIGGLAALQERWSAYARNQVASAIASSRGSENPPSQTERQ
jgi:hypothetical protein